MLGRETPRRLLCAVCGAAITDEGEAVAVGGRHVHTRTNPAGFEFTFGCFRAAPGASAAGDATVEHSWFAGCRWRFALCRACGTHLGWVFSGADDFVALILDRLEREDPDDP